LNALAATPYAEGIFTPSFAVLALLGPRK